LTEEQKAAMIKDFLSRSSEEEDREVKKEKD
jgi:hypothetical protein